MTYWLQPTTASDIIADAFDRAGIYGIGDTITSQDSALALRVLNDMVDRWSGDYLFVYALTVMNATMIPNQTTYTVGFGGNVGQARPTRIAYGAGVAAYTESGSTYPVNGVSRIEFQTLQGPAGASGLPNSIWYDAQYPLGVLNVAPTPGAGNTGILEFQAWTPFSTFPDLTSSFNFSAGCVEALKRNLAVELAPYFTDAAVSPDNLREAAASREVIRMSNATSRAMMGRGQPQARARA